MRTPQPVLPIVLALGAVIAPPAAEGQAAGKVPRIAVILSNSPVTEMLGPDPIHPHMRAFLQALRALGYVDGRNIVIERPSARSSSDRMAGRLRHTIAHQSRDTTVTISPQLDR